MNNIQNFGQFNGNSNRYDNHIKIFENFINEGSLSKLEIPTASDIESINKLSKNIFNTTIKSFLGSGVFGWAFELNNGKVMKFTTDESEALNAQRLVGKKTRNLINYHKVIRLKSSEKIEFGTGAKYTGYDNYGYKVRKNKRILKGFDNSYIILMDKIDAGLPKINKEILESYWSNHSTYRGWDSKNGRDLKNKLINSSDDELRSYCLSTLEKVEIWSQTRGWQKYTADANKKNDKDFLFIQGTKLNKIINIIFDIVKINQELWINKVTTTDVQKENMGIKDGKMIAFDFSFIDWGYDLNLIKYDSSYINEYNSIEEYYVK